MRWGKRQQRHQSSSSSSVSLLSNVFSFSWMSKLKQKATKPNLPTRPNPSPRSPPPARSASDHLSFDRTTFRYPHHPFHNPGRLSVGENDTLLARTRTRQAQSLLRSTRPKSVDDLEIEWRPISTRRPNSELSESLRRPNPSTQKADTTTSDTENDPLFLPHRRPPRRRRNSRPRNKPKVRVYSPRPSTTSRAEMGRVRVAERQRVAGLESFAVVKCSCDPQKDFRESMVEMIWERGIGRRPEELERLLACYLSLNSDEHHDVIVEVFRQVWFDLDPGRFDDLCYSQRLRSNG